MPQAVQRTKRDQVNTPTIKEGFSITSVKWRRDPRVCTLPTLTFLLEFLVGKELVYLSSIGRRGMYSSDFVSK